MSYFKTRFTRRLFLGRIAVRRRCGLLLQTE